jgi:nitroreductase
MDGNGASGMATERRPQALEALLTRRSVGQLCEPAPDRDDLARIIEAGLQAPDHGRLRPWRFVTIRGEARTAFAEMLVMALKRSDPAATEAMEGRIRTRILGVPLIIAVWAHIKTEGRSRRSSSFCRPARRRRTCLMRSTRSAMAACGSPAPIPMIAASTRHLASSAPTG